MKIGEKLNFIFSHFKIVESIIYSDKNVSRILNVREKKVGKFILKLEVRMPL